MSERLSYRVDGREFLERRQRAAVVLDRITSGEPFDPDELTKAWQAVVNEVPEIPFEPGHRYRVRCVAGKADVRHVHVQDQGTGAEYGLNLPGSRAPEFQDLELEFERRVARLPGGGSSTLWLLPAGTHALLGDIDILEVDELVEGADR